MHSQLHYQEILSPIIHNKDILTSFAHYFSQAIDIDNRTTENQCFPSVVCALVFISIICNHFDGVFATFQVYLDKVAGNLSTPTSLIGTASQISFKSSCVSFTAKNPMLLSRFLTLVIPVNHPINVEFNTMFKSNFMKQKFSIKQSLTKRGQSSLVVDVVGI